jgi:hypothetical protein
LTIMTLYVRVVAVSLGKLYRRVVRMHDR